MHGALTGAMASASASVDSKAELTALLEQWEREQQGSTQELVNILTKYVDILVCITLEIMTWFLIMLYIEMRCGF